MPQLMRHIVFFALLGSKAEHAQIEIEGRKTDMAIQKKREKRGRIRQVFLKQKRELDAFEEDI